MKKTKTTYPAIVHADQDLVPVLKRATRDELDALVTLLRKAKRCALREGSNTIPAIADAFQKMAVNYVSLSFFGEGKPYSSIVRMVANKVKAPLSECKSIHDVEWAILFKIFEEAENKLSPEDREKLYEELEKLSGRQQTDSEFKIKCLAGLATSQVVRTVIMRLVAAGMLESLGIATATRSVALGVGGRLLGVFTGPVGLVLTTLLLAWNLSGPAYSVMVPGVVLVAAMRNRQICDDDAKEMRGDGCA